MPSTSNRDLRDLLHDDDNQSQAESLADNLSQPDSIADNMSQAESIADNVSVAELNDLKDQSFANSLARAAVQPDDRFSFSPVHHVVDVELSGFFKRDSVMSAERKEHVVRILKKYIPLAAQERKRNVEKNAEYAKLCILDAFQGRLKNGLASNSKKGFWMYLVFCIQTSEWLYAAVTISSFLHTFSLFFEPYEVCPSSILFKVFQWSVLAIYAFDIFLKMTYEGRKVRRRLRPYLELKVTNECASLSRSPPHFRNISSTTGSSCIS